MNMTNSPLTFNNKRNGRQFKDMKVNRDHKMIGMNETITQHTALTSIMAVTIYDHIRRYPLPPTSNLQAGKPQLVKTPWKTRERPGLLSLTRWKPPRKPTLQLQPNLWEMSKAKAAAYHQRINLSITTMKTFSHLLLPFPVTSVRWNNCPYCALVVGSSHPSTQGD